MKKLPYSTYRENKDELDFVEKPRKKVSEKLSS